MAEPKTNPNSAPEFNRSEDCLPRKNKKEITDMNPMTEVKTNPNAATESFAQKFKKIYLGDDLDGFMLLVDKDAVWTFMATGETFRGIEQIRKASEKAMAGRIHTKDLHMELTNLFSGEEQVCIEYLHRGIMPEHSTITGSPAAGTEFAVPICITMHIKDGKFDRFNEYLDLATLSGVKQHLFSDTKPSPVSKGDPA